jgi:hypothetical protein
MTLRWSIATGYGLDDRMIGVRFPVGAGNFSLRLHVQTGSGAHPASYPMGTGGSFHEGKATGVSRSKNVWSYTSTPLYVFMAWYLVKHKENFTFTFTSTVMWPRQELHLSL